MALIDLSAPIRADPAEVPEPLRTEIEFADHRAGAAAIEAMFGVGPELLRDGEGWAVETFTRFGTHNSTHVDAPYHYNSTIGGRPARTIDELPLEWFHAPGVVVDVRHKADADAVTVEDLLTAQAEAALAAGRPGVFWAAHQADLDYAQIERLWNLGALPPTGFTVMCFPLRIVGASAAPSRVVALVP